MPRFWADLKTTDFAQLDAARSIAVLPLAATEQHGPHLPLSVDTDLVNGVVAHALAQREKRAGAVVLLSPACASFDQYPNFEIRGNRFRALVEDLVAKKGAA